MNLEQVYKQRLENFIIAQTTKAKTIFRISNVRIALFIGMVYCLIQFFSSNFAVMAWWWAFVAAIPVFLYLVQVHQRHFDEKSILDELVKINEKELEVLKTHQSQFPDGQEFVDANHDYSSDLDLFGKGSLFAFLNRTSTSKGKQFLADLLKQPLLDLDKIQAQQKAVQVLAPKIDFRQNFMANGGITEDTPKDINYLQEWAETPTVFLDATFWKITRIVMPALALVALAYFIITLDYRPVSWLMVFNFALLGIKTQYVGKEHTAIGKRQDILKMYVSLLNLAASQDFEDSKVLQEIKQTAQDAQSAFQKLSTIIHFFDQRLNIFVGLGLNLLILYDVQCLFALENWKKTHKKFLPKWLDNVAELDTLISLSTYYFNHPKFTFPQLENSDKIFIQAEDLGHPLIAEEIRVNNDTFLGEPHKVFVVTGSNMAGKSTFLRSVAINLLLAQCGAPVCAGHFRCSLMGIMTSMRVQDSISQHTSYFQAELLRLQYITNTLKAGKPTFIILDEILKGTNSEDKLLGSQLLVRRFLSFNCLAMVATHDLELGNMIQELPDKVENLCFESLIQDGELSFDYKLNKGIAKNKNATFLMHKMEIV